MMSPTLGDLYDRAMDNEPLVGALASVTWHLNMASHGGLWGGGDKDIAVLRVPAEADNEGAEGTTWNLQGKNLPFYEFPAYVNDLPPLSSYTEEIDREDGAQDGKWRDNSIEQYEEGWATPARIPYQGRMVEEVIAREGFGDDDVPDLLFVNFKAIDHVSHIWSANSPEMQDTLRWQDEDLGRFVEYLDREVGQGDWVLVLTADHGAQFDPEVSGAFQVTPGQLEQDLDAAFPSATDDSVFQAVRTSQIYVNEYAMRAGGYSFEQIAQFVLDYTKEQGAPDPSTVPADELADTVFSAAFPIEILPTAPLPARGAGVSGRGARVVALALVVLAGACTSGGADPGPDGPRYHRRVARPVARGRERSHTRPDRVPERRPRRPAADLARRSPRPKRRHPDRPDGTELRERGAHARDAVRLHAGRPAPALRSRHRPRRLRRARHLGRPGADPRCGLWTSRSRRRTARPRPRPCCPRTSAIRRA